MRSQLRAAAALAACLFAAASAHAASPDAAARLAGRAVGDTPLLADTRELCDTVGGRPVGSPANARAVAWAAAKFKAAGADAVATESFPVPFLWLPGTAELSIVTPESVSLRVVACPAAPSTNGALTARAVDAGSGTGEDFARLGAKAKGAIAVVRSKEMNAKAKEMLTDLRQLNITEIHAEVDDLSGGQRQAVAIARGVRLGQRVLILDEPTAALGVREAAGVLELIRNLRGSHRTMLLISHNLQHVFDVSDRITVLRAGRKVGTVRRDQTTSDQVVSMITGSWEAA